MAALILFLAPASRISAQSCLPPFDYYYTDSTISSIFPSGGTWPAGKRISITGKLTIDQSIELNDLDFIMSPNASIEVTGSNTVVTAINGTQFYGCTQMWLGITVINGSTVKFKQGTTLVRDAWIGLRFMSGANATNSELESALFENNHYGIAIFSMGSAASPFRFAKFSSNTIKRHAFQPLLPAPSSHPYAGSRPIRGIWILQSNVNLEFGASAQNKISECRYGLAVFGSTVTLANIRFADNKSDAAIADPNDGTDIFSSESFLTVSGFANSKCIFQSAENASIFSNKTKALTVSGAEFNNSGKHGIRCEASKFGALIDIKDNTFNMSFNPGFVSAIFIERPPGNLLNTNALVKNNFIKVDFLSKNHAGKILIDVLGKQDALTNSFDIEGNTLLETSSKDSISGIRVSGKGDNYHIWEENVLSWNTGAISTNVKKSLGIIAKDLTGNNHEISDNLIASSLSGDKSFLNAGIQASNAPFNLKICDNILTNTHLGIECKNALDLTDLKSNIIGSAAYGLICRSGTTMPGQIRHENRWTGSYFNWGAFYDGTPGFQFKYDDTNTIQDDDPPSWSPSFWFDDESGASNSNCTSSSAIPSVTVKERQYVDGAIAPDTATANWEARRILLYKLMRYPELTENDEDAEDYLNDNATAVTSPWQFARAEWLFDQAYKFSSAAANQLETLSPQYRAFVDSIMAYDLLQAQDTTTYDFTIAQNRANAFAQLCGKTESIDQQRASLEPSMQQALQTALTYAEGLPTAKAYENNLKNVLLIAIRYALGDSLTTADTTTLRNIANQCPQYGGMSVFRAPHWLSHEESVAYVTKDWATQCGGERSMPGGKQMDETSVQVLPNPANGQVRFVFPENIAAARWQISDVAGRIVQQGSAADAMLEIDATDWKAGFYFLTCQNDNGRVSTVKFSIAH